MSKIDWTQYDHTKTYKENEFLLCTTRYTIYAHCKKHGLPLPAPCKRGRNPGKLLPSRKIPADADLTLSLTYLAKLYNVDTGRIVRERQRRGIKGDVSKRRLNCLRLDADTTALVRDFAKTHKITAQNALKKLIHAGLALPFEED